MLEYRNQKNCDFEVVSWSGIQAADPLIPCIIKKIEKWE
jgi:hypothetical protein